MKRKISLIFLALVCALCCAFGLTACGGGNGTDKSFQNIEFVEYRKAVTAVLKDNGIFVNEFDTAKNTQRNTVATYVKLKSRAASWADSKTPVKNLLQKEENLRPSENYDFARDQVYAISLRPTLCIGDGLSNYFNEKNLFDIVSNMFNSYWKITNQGNTYTIMACAPSNDAAESYTHIELEFNSETDYTFTNVEWHSDQDGVFFAYGNSDHELLMLTDYEAIYSPDGLTFYVSDNASVVAQCVEQVMYAKPDNEQPYKELKSQVQYNFTEKQSDALFDKYFKDVQSSTQTDEQRHGIKTETLGGITYADHFFAVSDKTTIEIPSNIEYIHCNFTVYDRKGNVTKLYIPKSVKGIVKTQDDKTGQVYSTPQVIDASKFDLCLLDDSSDSSSQDSGYKPFKSIIVESGSPIFKSGTGHLFTTSNKLVYIADMPMDDIDFDSIDGTTLNRFGRYEETGATGFYLKTTEVNLDLSKDYTTNESGWGLRETWSIISPYYKTLQRVNVVGSYDDEDLNIEIDVHSNFTINLDISNTWEWHKKGVGLLLRSDENKSYTVTVNWKGLTRVNVSADQNVTVNVYTEMPQALYQNIDNVMPPESRDNITYHFKTASITQAQENAFRFSVHFKSSTPEVLATFVGKSDEAIAMPEKFGLDVTALQIRNSAAYEIALNSKIKYIIISDNFEVGGDFPTLVYDGTRTQFEEMVNINADNNDRYIIRIKDKDGNTQLLRGSNAPTFYTITYNINGEHGEDMVREGSRYLFYVANMNLDTAHYVYYIVDDRGNAKYVYPYYEYVEVNPERDTHYTLVRHALEFSHSYGESNDYYATIYNVEFMGIKVEVNVMFDVLHYQYYDELRTSVQISGRNEDDTLRIIGSLNNLFDSYPIRIERNGNFEDKVVVRLDWIWNESGDLTLNGITEIKPDEKEKINV